VSVLRLFEVELAAELVDDLAALVPVTTVSPAARPLLISAREVVTRPTCTAVVVVWPAELTTCTVYDPAESDRAVGGIAITSAAWAVVTAALADMPASTVAGGSVSVTVAS
jgi:hypothetical protein